MEWLCILGHLTMVIFIHLTGPGIQGQSCLESSSEIEISNIRSQYKQSILPGGLQAIFPGYRFNCSGSIREWTIEVTQLDKYYFDLQVWRPSDSSTWDDTQRFVLIGQNSIKRVVPDLPAKNSSELGEAIQIMIRPSPEDQVHFEPGDVLGVYVYGSFLKGSGIALLLSEQGDKRLKEELWYAMVDKQVVVDGRDCPQTTTLDTFTNAVPAISVSVTIATDNDHVMPATAIDYCSQYIVLSRNGDDVNSPSAHTGLIIGVVSMVISFILCITTVLLLYQKIKRKWQTNAPITTTDPGTTTPARKNVCYSAGAMREHKEINAPIGFTTTMRDNVCYSVVQNQEIDGSYPYSYPYFSSMLSADMRGRPSEDHILQAHQGIITVAANCEMAGENVAMKQRSCENEEDIYSYII